MRPGTELEQLRRHVDRRRLLATAERLVGVRSVTGEAGGALDELAAILREDGFAVERADGGHPAAPAVVTRLDSGTPGPCLQFNGHLDVVHLPYVPPRIDGGRLLGSGACDMKGGTAAAVEALRALRDAGALPSGSVLLTAHDLHEAPWGFSEQLHALIAQGIVGDAALIPEPLCDCLPVAGRGHGWWKATVHRAEPPVHEVMRAPDLPDVLASCASLVGEIQGLDQELACETHEIAGRSSAFVGQIHVGEIYNQSPQQGMLEGTRRWVPGSDPRQVEDSFRSLMRKHAERTRTTIDVEFRMIRDAFHLDLEHSLVASFDAACRELTGETLPRGAKPFVDDGNSFWSLAGIPAITHGPRAGGQHTTQEWVEIDDMVRIATLYARSAVLYCGSGAAS